MVNFKKRLERIVFGDIEVDLNLPEMLETTPLGKVNWESVENKTTKEFSVWAQYQFIAHGFHQINFEFMVEERYFDLFIIGILTPDKSYYQFSYHHHTKRMEVASVMPEILEWISNLAQVR